MKNLNKKMKFLIVTMLIAVMGLGVVGIPSVYALFNASTNEANNEFKSAVVNVAVIEKTKEHEDFSNNTEYYEPVTNENKSADKIVSIKNKGNVAYVRVTFDAALVSDTGRIPLDDQDIDYTFRKNTAWKVDNNQVYYYTKALNQGDESDILLEKVTINRKIPGGYHLEVKVLNDAISAKKSSYLQDAWGISNFSNLNSIQ